MNLRYGSFGLVAMALMASHAFAATECTLTKGNCPDTVGLPTAFSYTIDADTLKIAGWDEGQCVGTKAKKNFHFQGDKCNLVSFGEMDNGEVILNDTDGCYAYYSCN